MRWRVGSLFANLGPTEAKWSFRTFAILLRSLVRERSLMRVVVIISKLCFTRCKFFRYYLTSKLCIKFIWLVFILRSTIYIRNWGWKQDNTIKGNHFTNKEGSNYAVCKNRIYSKYFSCEGCVWIVMNESGVAVSLAFRGWSLSLLFPCSMNWIFQKSRIMWQWR